jgi:anti-sigma regulatory factor (Ser/Thr protein kinase)
MERIILEVDKGTAKRWRATDKGKKKKINALIKLALKENDVVPANEPEGGYGLPSEKEILKQIRKIRQARPDYISFLNTIRDKAAKNGLTQEVLDSPLAIEA